MHYNRKLRAAVFQLALSICSVYISHSLSFRGPLIADIENLIFSNSLEKGKAQMNLLNINNHLHLLKT